MPFLPNVGRKAPTRQIVRRAPAPVDTGQIQRASGLASWQQNKPYVPPSRSTLAYDVDTFISETYERLTWCFRCVNAIAWRAATLRTVVRQDDFDNGPEIDGHDLLNLLNYEASPIERAIAFRFRLSAQILTSPRGAFVEIQPNRSGGIAAFNLLPPMFTRPIPHPTLFVSGYEVRIGADVTVIPADNVLWFKMPHPTNPYRSFTPAEAAGLAIDTAWLARAFNANFLRNDGRPGGLISIDGGLSEPDADEIKSYFENVKQAGKWRVFEGGDIHVAELGSTPRDAQYLEGMKDTKEEVLMSYGVPESILGNAAGRTFDNVDGEMEIFWYETMPPHLRIVGSGFDRLDEDPTTFTSFDTSTVGIVQRVEARRHDTYRQDFQAGLITLYEFREKCGFDVDGLDYDAANTLYRPMSQVAIGTTDGTQFQDSAAPKPVAPPPVIAPPRQVPNENQPPALPPPPGEPAPTPPKARAREKATRGGNRDGVSADDADAHRANLRQLAALHIDHWEKLLHSTMVAFFHRQERVVLARLQGPKVRKGTRHWHGAGKGTKAIRSVDIFHQDKWNEELRQTASDFLTGLYSQVGTDTLGTLGLGLSFDMHNKRVTKAITSRVDKIVGINDTTEGYIREELVKGEAVGDSILQLASRIRDVFTEASQSRAETIARTEVVGATNEAQVVAADTSGVVDTKEWLATSDARTRESHSEVDGEQVGLDEQFSNGLDFPGDPNGEADEVINCRCTVLFNVGGSTTEQDAAE